MENSPQLRECHTCRRLLVLREDFYRCSSVTDSFYKTCKECKRTRVRELNNQRGTRRWAKHKLTKLQKRSVERGWECDLDIGFVQWLYSYDKKCVYCGFSRPASFDRCDGSLGYLKSNFVVSCLPCNITRSNKYSYTEMLVLGKALRKIYKMRLAL